MLRVVDPTSARASRPTRATATSGRPPRVLLRRRDPRPRHARRGSGSPRASPSACSSAWTRCSPRPTTTDCRSPSTASPASSSPATRTARTTSSPSSPQAAQRHRLHRARPGVDVLEHGPGARALVPRDRPGARLVGQDRAHGRGQPHRRRAGARAAPPPGAAAEPRRRRWRGRRGPWDTRVPRPGRGPDGRTALAGRLLHRGRGAHRLHGAAARRGPPSSRSTTATSGPSGSRGWGPRATSWGSPTAIKIATRMTRLGDGQVNGGIPAGYTYLGQFLDHDLTFDKSSARRRHRPARRPAPGRARRASTSTRSTASAPTLSPRVLRADGVHLKIGATDADSGPDRSRTRPTPGFDLPARPNAEGPASPTRATTRTWPSPRRTPRSSASTTGWSTRSRPHGVPAAELLRDGARGRSCATTSG